MPTSRPRNPFASRGGPARGNAKGAKPIGKKARMSKGRKSSVGGSKRAQAARKAAQARWRGKRGQGR